MMKPNEDRRREDHDGDDGDDDGDDDGRFLLFRMVPPPLFPF